MNRHYKGIAGFTVIEIIIVISVISILAAIVIYSGSNYINRTNESTFKTKLSTAAGAMKNYYNKEGSYSCTGALSGVDTSGLTCNSDSSTFTIYGEEGGTTYYVTQNDATAQTGTPPGSSPPCPGTYSDLSITGSTSGGTVWGTDIYTHDSNLPKAAVHAGVITAGQTATVRVCNLPGQSSYTGTTRNGVTTSSYGVWGNSISFTLP